MTTTDLLSSLQGQISDEQLRCQTINHPWDDIPKPQSVTTMYALSLWYRCLSCGMVKQESYSIYGEVIYRRYFRPAGWKKLTRDVRRSHLRTIYRKSMFDLHNKEMEDANGA